MGSPLARELSERGQKMPERSDYVCLSVGPLQHHMLRQVKRTGRGQTTLAPRAARSVDEGEALAKAMGREMSEIEKRMGH